MNFKQRRIAKGMTQVELGRIVGRTGAYISLVERHKTTASARMLSRIEDAIDAHEGKRFARGYCGGFQPFKDDAEKKKLREIWCERYGGTMRRRDEMDAPLFP